MRSDQFDSSSNEHLLSTSLDLAEERREVAIVKLSQYQQKLRQGYEKCITIRAFVPRDLVLRRVVNNMKNPSWGKLSPNQERPYWVTSVAGVGAYRLEDLSEISVPRPWNVNNLRKYYYQCESLYMIKFICIVSMYLRNLSFVPPID